MHAIEKIMAKASAEKSVSTGDIVEMQIDHAMLHDRGGPKVIELLKKYKISDKQVAYPESIEAFFDHDAPSTKINSAARQKEWKDYAQKNGIKNIFGPDCGISHVLMMENGMLRPNQVVVGTDSHACTGGALGAFATGIGETEMAAVLMTGKLWFKVPAVVKVVIEGTPLPYVGPKDVMLYLLQNFGTGRFIYSAIEFCGSYIDALSIEERSIISSMSIELGGKVGYIAPDEKCLQYLQNIGYPLIEEPLITDKDYTYAETLYVNVDELSPMMAFPHGFSKITEATEQKEIHVDQAVIGSCTGGLLEDIRLTARILKGQKVASDTRLIVTPATKNIYLTALKNGWVDEIVSAGAIFNPPRCGPCGSSHDGILAPDEVCITNANRNFKGRLGSPLARIYLASTATVAASAIAGYISVYKETRE